MNGSVGDAGSGPPDAPAAESATIALVVNPYAGRGRGATLVAAVAARLGGGGASVRILQSRSADDAPVLCRDAVAEGVSALAVLGGDGTVHAALQAVAGTPVPLGIVPAGTGNDLARCLSVPLDPLTAADAAAAAVAAGTSIAVDAARAADATGRVQWWAGVLSAGFDSAVTERANRLRWPRGRRRYDVAIFAELVRLRAREFILGLDGRTVPVMATFIAVGNAPAYGGGMQICPHARLDDGLLDITVVGPISRSELVRIKPRVYDGSHLSHPAVSTHRARRVEIAASDLTAYADGERIGALPVRAEAVPGAVRLLRPAKPAETGP